MSCERNLLPCYFLIIFNFTSIFNLGLVQSSNSNKTECTSNWNKPIVHIQYYKNFEGYRTTIWNGLYSIS